VASAVIYTPVANLTALAALTPTNGDYFELTDSTGAESSALITGVTVGLVGAPGLTFRLRYDAPPGIFTFLGYFANDSETRYLKLQGGTVTGNLEIGTTGSLTFEGSTANAFETTVAVVDPTADRTITLPNVTGTVVTTGDTGSVTNTMLAGSIDKAKVTGTAITAADTGTVTSTMILDGTIVDGDVNASAAIAGTKISPNFGSQNVVTTGTSSAAALIPTGSSVPTNGTYLPAANAVAIATNSTERLRIDSSGRLGLGTSSPGYPLDLVSSGGESIRIRGTSGTEVGKLLFTSNNAGTDYGWLSSASSYLAFGTASTERMRLTSTGLGIGVTSPQELLHVNTGSSGGQVLRMSTNGADTGYLYQNSGAVLLGAYSTRIVGFETNGSERARIDSSGRLLVGTSTPYAGFTKLMVEGSGDVTGMVRSTSIANNEQAALVVRGTNGGNSRQQQYGIFKHADISNPCGYLGLICEDENSNLLWVDNSDVLRISTNAAHIGTTSGTVVGTQTSDERLKNILGPVEYGLNTLKQIEPVRYSLKSQPDIEQLGFIAQQVQPLVPQSVFDTKEHIEGEPEDAPTKLGMEYVALIPVLINAVKELSAEMDALKAQLQTS
jgi:hypothetical protein